MNMPMDDRHAWSLERLEEYVAGGLSADERAALEGHAAQCAACGPALRDLTEMDQTMQKLFGDARPAADFEERIISRLWRATWRARISTPTMKRLRFTVAASFVLASSGLFATYAVQNNVLSNPMSGALADSGHEILPTWFQALAQQDQYRSALSDTEIQKIGAQARLANLDDDTRNLMGEAHELYQNQQYDQARRVLDKVIATDPTNNSARLFSEIIQDRINYRSNDDSRRRSDETLRQKIAGKDGVIPYSQMLYYPEDWPELSHRRVGKAGSEARIPDAPTGARSSQLVSRGIVGYESVQGPVRGENSRNIDASTTPHGTPRIDSDPSLANSGVIDRTGATPAGSPPMRGGILNDDTSVSSGSVSLDFSRDALKQKVSGLPDSAQDRDAAHASAEAPKSEVADARWYDSPEAQKQQDGDIRNGVADAGASGREEAKPGPGAASAASASAAAAAQQVAADRKVIRSGTMEFEVRNFDDAAETIGTVVTEEGGFVSGTNSEKLVNGKVKGTIVVRVDPARLDRVVLKLRGLGELKTQQISAQDITKEYTDLESELRANRAMEERMLDIIKTGKGSIKELVEAEKQLGVYREKIEKIEGEKRYYDNLVGLSTLSITLYEKDIQTAATAAQMENVVMSVEAEDVEGKFADAKEAIEKDSGGRIIKAELRRFEASQLAAQIVCDVPADKADLLVARFKQLGRVAGLDRVRSQSTPGGAEVPAGVKVEQKDTQISLSLYNLANIAPRQTAVLTIAVPDVEEAYNKVLGRVRLPMGADKGDGAVRPTVGVVVTSNIAGQNADQMTADVRADVRVTEAAAVLADLRQLGEVMNATITENPDTANVTTSKEGIALRLVAVAAVPPREGQTLQLAAADVAAAYQKLVDAVRPVDGGKGGRILQSQLNQQDPRTVTGTLQIDLRRADQAAFETAMTASGLDVVSRNVTRSTDTANTLDSKVRYDLTLTGAENLPARQSTTAAVEVEDVERAAADLHAAIAASHGKELDAGTSKDAGGHMVGRIVAEVPLDQAGALQSTLQGLGKERTDEVSQNPQATDGPLARAHFEITLSNAEMLVPQDKTIGSTLRAAVAASLGTLLWTLYLIVNGLLVIGPFAVVAWMAWKVMKRKKVAG